MNKVKPVTMTDKLRNMRKGSVVEFNILDVRTVHTTLSVLRLREPEGGRQWKAVSNREKGIVCVKRIN